MRKRNVLLKALALFLSVALLHYLVELPGSALTAQRRLTQAILAGDELVLAPDDEQFLQGIDPIIEGGVEFAPAPIVDEVVEMRDGVTRHFRHADGTFSAAVFSQPIHFLAADGTWLDIDNTLVRQGDFYVPTASALEVRLPRSFAGGQQMTIAQDGFSLGFGVSASNEDVQLEAQAQVVEAPMPLQAFSHAELSVEEQNAQMMAAENLEGSVLYAELFAGADWEQTVTPSGLETSIVIAQAQDNVEFLFDFSLDGLVAVPQEDGSIFFFAAADAVNVIELERPANAVENPAEEPQEEAIEDEIAEEDSAYCNENEEISPEETAGDEDYDVLQELYPAEEIELEPEHTTFAPVLIGESIEGAEPVFILQVPVMMDANGEMAFAEMGFADDGTLVIRADAEFMAAAAYPVTISPSVETNAITNISMPRVSSGFTVTDLAFVGFGGNEIHRTYVHFNLPDLPCGSVVQSAVFGVTQTGLHGQAAGNFLSLLEIPTSVADRPSSALSWDQNRLNWSPNSINWDNQPLIGNPSTAQRYIVDTLPMASMTLLRPTHLHWFNITNTVRNWYEHDSNNGLVFTTFDESSVARATLARSVPAPVVVIAYSTNVSLQPHLTYEVFDMGRSGTAFVNVHNGNLTWVHETISMPGERLPIQISHIYNSSHNENFSGQFWNMHLFPGFRLNVIEQLAFDWGDIFGPRFRHVDGLGVVHYFAFENIEGNYFDYVHEFDPTLRLRWNTVTHNVVLSDAQGNERHFNLLEHDGFMTRMEDRHGNFQNINWSNGRITSVVDSVGRSVTFGYTADGFLSSMTDQAGRVTTLGYEGFTYPDGRRTGFGGRDNVAILTTYDFKRVDFHYTQTAQMGRRVTRVDQFGQGGPFPVDSIRLEFSETNVSGTASGHTTVRNREYLESGGERGRRDVFLFTPFGAVQSVTNRQGQTQITNFHDSAEDLARLNQVASASDWLTIPNNLLRNHGFERSEAWQQQSGSERVAYAIAQSSQGRRSLQLRTTDVNNFSAGLQRFGDVGQRNQTYTFSIDVLIPEELRGSGGASIGFRWVNSNGLMETVSTAPMRSTNGWERVSVTFTVPDNANLSADRNLAVMMWLTDAVGEVFFDNAQLEQSGGPLPYNLIENSGLWFGSDNWELEPNVHLRDQYIGQAPFIAFAGSPEFGIRTASQTVPLNAFAGETLVIGGQGAAYATPLLADLDPDILPQDQQRQFHIQAIVRYSAGVYSEPIIIPFASYLPQAWQTAVGYYTLTRDAEAISFSFVYGNQVREASFRNAFIYVAPFGLHIEYDDDGQPTEMRSGAGESLHIEYDNHQPTRIEQRHGGRVTSSMRINYTADGDVEYVFDEKTGMVTSFTYDTHGNVTSRTITNGELSLTETMRYTPCGNFVREHADFNGGVSTFDWDVNRGLLMSATDPNGNTVSYTYCPTTDRLLTVSGQAHPGQVVTTSFDVRATMAIITRSHRGTTYRYRYDSRGRTTHAMVGDTALVTNAYNDLNNQLISQLFANGDLFEPVFDSRGRLVAEYWNGERAVTYYYNENDRLSQLVDHTGDEDVTQRFDYDFAGRLVRVSGSDGLNSHITYDANGAPTLLHTELNGEIIHDSLFLTNAQGQPMDASFFTLGASLSYAYDGLNRPVQRSLIMPGAAVSTSLSFTDNLVTSFRNELFGGALLHEWEYEYDAAGNITRIVDHHGRETQFTFDGLNRLTSETIDGILWEYEFDAGGNITRIRRDGRVEHNLNFSDPDWPDQLTAFDGRTITYDRMGNPTRYGNYSFTWERGRLLTHVYYNGVLQHRFGYDAAGRRVSRTSYDGPEPVTTRFYYMGQQLVRQCDGTDTLDFTWDADGRPVGFAHNGVPYFYLHNLLGDVVAIADADGNIVAEYTYDAWGNVTVHEAGQEPIIPPSPPSHDELLAFVERISLQLQMALHGVDEHAQQVLAPAISALGFRDRAAAQAYFATHGACISTLDTALGSLDIWTVTWNIFIPVFLGETTLNAQQHGELYPFFSYYSQLFAQIIEVLVRYTGLEPNAATLRGMVTVLAAVLRQAMHMASEESLQHIQASERALQMVYSAFKHAGVPETAQLGLMMFALSDITCPNRMYSLMRFQLGMSSQEATATIEAWRSGGEVCPDLFRRYLNGILGSMFGLGEVAPQTFDLMFNIYLANFARFAQDWDDVFGAGHLAQTMFAQVSGFVAEQQPQGGFLSAFSDEMAAIEPDSTVLQLLQVPAAALLQAASGEQSQPLPAQGIGHLNPIRYRGKFYCDAMGWYWLQTRFYNPQWRRFINADTFFIAGQCNISAITASNMFAYANNNPVMFIDPDGRSAVVAFLASIPVWGWIAIYAVIALATTVIFASVVWGLSSLFENGTWTGVGRIGLALLFGIAVPLVVLSLISFGLYEFFGIDFAYTAIVLPAFELVAGAVARLTGRYWPDIPPNPGETLEEFLARIDRSISTSANSRVDVVVSGNTVTITTGFTYSGTLVGRSLSGIAYTQLFEDGINAWRVSYDNVFGSIRVTVNVVIDNARPANRRLNVDLRDELGGSRAATGPSITGNFRHMIIYRGDPGNAVPDYTAPRFRRVVTHEFGHILGLNDVYNRPGAPDSIMNNPFTTPVQRIDVEAFIRAHAMGMSQRPRE